MKFKNPVKALLLGFSIIGIFLTVFIEAGTRIESLKELCGGATSGCSQVEESPYSSVFGVPLTLLGFMSYVGLVIFLYRSKVWFIRLISFLLGAEFYLVYLQWQVIGTFCLFCMVQFGLVLTLFLITLFWYAPGPEVNGSIPTTKTPLVKIVPIFFFLGIVPLMGSHYLEPGTAPPSEMSAATSMGTEWGRPDSALLVEIFSDYQCGYCRKYEPVIGEMKKEFPHIRIIFRDYLIRSHSLSPMATAYADWIFFKDGLDSYFKVRDEIFENQPNLHKFLSERFQGEKISPEMQKKVKEKIDRDLQRARQFNVNSTPTTVITHQGKIVKILRGYVSLEELEKFLSVS